MSASDAIRQDPDLGRVPDAVLAARHGCSLQLVQHARWYVGVPSYAERRRHARVAAIRDLLASGARTAEEVRQVYGSDVPSRATRMRDAAEAGGEWDPRLGVWYLP